MEPSNIRILRHTDGTEYACNQIDGGTKLSPYLSSGSRYGWRRKTQRTSSSLRQLPAPWLDPGGRGADLLGQADLLLLLLPYLPVPREVGGRGAAPAGGGGREHLLQEGGEEKCVLLLCWRFPHLPQPPFRGEAARIIHHHTPKLGPHSLRGV